MFWFALNHLYLCIHLCKFIFESEKIFYHSKIRNISNGWKKKFYDREDSELFITFILNVFQFIWVVLNAKCKTVEWKGNLFSADDVQKLFYFNTFLIFQTTDLSKNKKNNYQLIKY